MFAEHQRLKSCFCDIANGCLCGIEMSIRGFVLYVLLLQRCNFLLLNTNSHRADLPVISNDDKFLAHV